MLDCSDEEIYDESDLGSPADSSLMAVSDAVPSQPKKRRTMQLQGLIGKHEVLVLVDSGSITSFISEAVVHQLQLPVHSIFAEHFTVADGGSVHCAGMVKNLQWWTQGHSFTQDMKSYISRQFDIILGADWMEAHSPMWVHRKHKKMRFTHEGKRILLQGLRPDAVVYRPVACHKLRDLLKRKVVAHMVQLNRIPQNVAAPIAAITEPTPQTIVPQDIQRVLDKFPQVFHESHALPPHRRCDHTIELILGTQPVNAHSYRLPPNQKDEVEKQLRDMLQKGLIRLSSSPFASPVLLVRKKDGTWRFCIDYRKLNALTVKNKHPMPVVEELLDELAGSSWFLKLDLRSGFHQIRVAPKNVYKTAFRTHQGLYEFVVMPFGLTWRLMNEIFAPLLRKGALVFLDDILIYIATLEDHTRLLVELLQILATHNLLAKPSKCSFPQQTIEYLGHVISSKGVSTNPGKIQAVIDWPQPTNIKEIRGFLGLTGYYRRFIKHYSLISRPLTLLLRKGTPFVWSSVTQEAFDLLKQALVSAPILALPQFQKPFTLETDASDVGLGAILMQDSHPLAFLS